MEQIVLDGFEDYIEGEDGSWYQKANPPEFPDKLSHSAMKVLPPELPLSNMKPASCPKPLKKQISIKVEKKEEKKKAPIVILQYNDPNSRIPKAPIH